MKFFFGISLLTIGAPLILADQENGIGWSWRWTCDIGTDTCKKQREPTPITESRNQDTKIYNSLSVCRLVCGSYGALWPKPTILTSLKPNVIPFNHTSIDAQIPNVNEEVKSYLLRNVHMFRDNIRSECGSNCIARSNIKVVIYFDVRNSELTFNWETNETYSLYVVTGDSKVTVRISADNAFGARHGLETLAQLIAADPVDGGAQRVLVMVSQASIKDRPLYPHRGLLIDTGRNFLQVATIKKQIDAMAASKMNVLHWHATDSQSFPLVLPSVPQMAKYGAYSQKKTYSPADVRDLLEYAKLRGVRIIVEFDAPAHAGNGWQWGRNGGVGDLAVCVNQQPWRSFCIQPPCGQLNPVNENLFEVLRYIYRDLVDIFSKGEVFHMGGDEVYFPCWKSAPNIMDYLRANGKNGTERDFLDLWGKFQEGALNIYDSEVGNNITPIILWSSTLTNPTVISSYLPKSRYVIQTWVPSSDKLPKVLLNMGYKLIVSIKDAWYLDHGFWGSTRYYTWRTVYSSRLSRQKGVLGGEVCMWGELVDDHNIDNRIWPRAAAVAERLWSDPDTGTNSAEQRFYRHRERLILRGVQAEAVAPRWCYQNEGECS